MDLTANVPADLIKDGNEANFMADVVETSKTVPVIVDFWAPWCGPCKTLGPALEAAVTKARGKVKMVKIDVDQNQGIAGQLRIQSIPTVYAFVNGQPVDGFTGAQTPAQIDAFIARVVAQSPAGADDGLDEALEAAAQMLEAGEIDDAVQTYAAILGEDEGNVAAIAGLARCYVAQGLLDDARGILDKAPMQKANDAAILAVRAQIDLAEAAAGAGDLGELQARVDADASDHQARFELAEAMLANRQTEAAIEQLLELYRRDRDWNEAAAKTQLIKVFDSLGPKDPLALKGRRRLSSLAFA
ncbi:thioredoxin [Abyssibius alkaniclasticus]|uniref:thioredoxin n=1 Tax=Abyssibius alkaniclasticus TaxID=2881234 RepID=UPI00236426D4|nr:thioredoxin [Abyssibius alkaniclasticus]UPH72030.1 thioredoxin [Abyssibius alkaniclasticus]